MSWQGSQAHTTQTSAIVQQHEEGILSTAITAILSNPHCPRLCLYAQAFLSHWSHKFTYSMMSFGIPLFTHVPMVPGHPSSQRTTLSPQLPMQVCAREPPRGLIHQWCWSLYDFPRYIWTLPMMFVEQRGVWIALKPAMFEMLSLCINLSWLKIILSISTARLCSQAPTTLHTPVGFLNACTDQEHFQPEFVISEPTLNCNAKLESERCSHFSPISAEFNFFFFFALVFCSNGSCSLLQRMIYLIKGNLGAAWHILGSLEHCQKA